MDNVKEYLYVMDFSDVSISEIEIIKEDKDLETCDFGYSIKRFIDTAIKENAITEEEIGWLKDITITLTILKRTSI